MCGRTARDRRIMPSTLTAMTRDHTSSVTSCIGAMASMIPAMFARQETADPTSATISRTADSSVMSATFVVTSKSARERRRSSRREAEISTAMTRPPSRATLAAVARPMPDPAPVTMTVFPEKRPGVISSVHGAVDGGGDTGTEAAGSGSEDEVGEVFCAVIIGTPLAMDGGTEPRSPYAVPPDLPRGVRPMRTGRASDVPVTPGVTLTANASPNAGLVCEICGHATPSQQRSD